MAFVKMKLTDNKGRITELTLLSHCYMVPHSIKITGRREIRLDEERTAIDSFHRMSRRFIFDYKVDDVMIATGKQGPSCRWFFKLENELQKKCVNNV